MARTSTGKSQNGFSILEVLAVVVILAITASIVSINVSRTLESAKRRELLHEVASFIDRARLASLLRPVILATFLEQDDALAAREEVRISFSENAHILQRGACAPASMTVEYKGRDYGFNIAAFSCEITVS